MLLIEMYIATLTSTCTSASVDEDSWPLPMRVSNNFHNFSTESSLTKSCESMLRADSAFLRKLFQFSSLWGVIGKSFRVEVVEENEGTESKSD